MPSLVQRIASALGYTPAVEVSALATRVQAAEATAEIADTRTRMLRSRLNELASGVPMSWGGFQYEHNRALQGSAGWATRDRMEDDPAVKEALQTRTVPLLTARWDIEPASDDPRDIDIADFCRAVLLRRSSKRYGKAFWCQNGWETETLPNIMRALPDGYSILGKSTREVNGMVVYDRLQWIEPSSVDDHGWILDANDNLVEIRRTYRDPLDQARFMEPLAVEAIALFPWDIRGARFMGRPMTRQMYTAWAQKELLQKIAVIWARKVGAPIPIGSYPDAWKSDPATIAKFESFVQQCRGTSDTDGFFSGPQNSDGQKAEVSFAGSNVGEVDRLGHMIDGRNAEIARGVSKSGQLGETTQGSRALSEPMSRRELMMTQATAVWACQILNHGIGNVPGLLEWLVDANFQVEEYPSFTVTKIDKHEGIENLPQLIYAVEAKLLPDCIEVSKAVASVFDIQIPQERFDELQREREEAKQAAKDAQDALAKGVSGMDQPTDDAALSASLSMTVEEVTAALAPLMEPAYAEKAPNGRRAVNRFEDQYMNLAAIQAALDGGERRAADVIRRMRAAMTAEIVKRIESGRLSAASLDKERTSGSGAAKKYTGELRAALVRSAEDGAGHVRSEVAAARTSGKAVAA